MSTKVTKSPTIPAQTTILITGQNNQIEELNTLINRTTNGRLPLYDPEHPDIHSINNHLQAAITIEMIKTLKKRLIFKPYVLSIQIGVIFHAHNLTTEAQNSLLKVLEDPPNNTFFILITDQYKKLLETILSRAQLVHRFQFNNQTAVRPKSEFDETSILAAFEKISAISDIKDQQEKKAYSHLILDSLVEKYHKKWLTSHGHDKVVLAQLNEIQKTRDAIEANVNIRLCLESLIMQLHCDK